MAGTYGAVFMFLLVTSALAMVAADKKGRNEWVVGIFCFFTGTGLIVALYFALFARHAPRATAETHEPASPYADRTVQLERLARLRDEGSLTEDEFSAEKARLLRD
jgi:hypothetical protein